MKNKIKEALRQEYKSRLELDDDQLEGVAAFASTFVTDEGKIEEFVKSDATLAMLKSYQSMLDKDRAKRKGEGDQGQQGSKPGENTASKTENQGIDQAALAKMISDAVAAANKPFIEQLNAMKAEKAIEDVISTVNSRIDAWGYGKGYPKEMEKARKHAMKLYEANGKKWSADELEAAIKEEFNDEVDGRGIDTTKPFKSDGGGDKKDSNRAFAEEIRAALGMKDKE